jgi:hypothetical protein
MAKDLQRSFRPGDAVECHHDDFTVVSATVLRPFDDGYLIQLAPRWTNHRDRSPRA